MTFFIKIIITCPGFFCIWFWRDCIGFAVFCNIWPNFFWTIRFISKDIAFRDVYFFQSINRMLAVRIISGTDQKFYRISKTVYNCMELCVQSSTCSSDGFFCSFLRACVHRRFKSVAAWEIIIIVSAEQQEVS